MIRYGCKHGLQAWYKKILIFFKNNLILVWTPEEMREKLIPLFEKVYNSDPESGPFLQPVNPEMLGIPVS